MIIKTLLLIILVITMCISVTLYHMLKYNRNFLKQIQSIRGTLLEMLEIGEEAPLFRIHDEKNRKVVASQLFKEKNTLLFFAHSQCTGCKDALKQIKKIDENYDLNIVVINRDTQFDDSEIKKLLPDSVYYIRESFIATSYRVQSTPSIFIIEDGKVKLTTVLKDTNMLFNSLLDEKTKDHLKLSV